MFFENRSIKLEIDGKSKVGIFAKSSQVVLDTSNRLEVDFGSLWYQVGSDWQTKAAHTSIALSTACRYCCCCYSIILGIDFNIPVITTIILYNRIY